MLSYIILYLSTHLLQERSMMLIDAIIIAVSFIITETNNENKQRDAKIITVYLLVVVRYMLVISNIFSKMVKLVYCSTSIFIFMVKLSNVTVFVCEIIVLSCLYLLPDHPYVNNLLNQHN